MGPVDETRFLTGKRIAMVASNNWDEPLEADKAAFPAEKDVIPLNKKWEEYDMDASAFQNGPAAFTHSDSSLNSASVTESGASKNEPDSSERH